MALRTNEHSLRALIAITARTACRQLALSGLAQMASTPANTRTDEEAEEIIKAAILAYDLRRAIDWLEGLDEALCPEVPDTTPADIERAIRERHYAPYAEGVKGVRGKP